MMKAVAKTRFLSWLADFRIGIDPAFERDWPRNLTFLDDLSQRRFWTCDGDAGVVCEYLAAIVDSVDGEGSLFLWPKVEDWMAARFERSGCESNPLWRTVLSSLQSVPDDGAIEFEKQDRDQLLSILYCAHTFGWSWPDDLFIVPSNGTAIVMLDHHDAVWIETNSSDRMQQVISHMADCGYELPTSPPG